MTISSPEERKRSIFITCQGTRGDVQPYQHLGMALQRNGWSVTIGAPPEFGDFITSAGLRYINIGNSPTHTLYNKSVSGGSSSPLKTYMEVKKFFNPSNQEPFTTEWFRRILHACRDIKPDVLILVFTAWCGAAVIPELLGLPTRVVASYPMPMAPSREFAVSMAGSGYSMHFHFLNIMHWRFSELFIVQSIHLKAARRTLEIIKREEAEAGRSLPGAHTVKIDKSLNTSKLSSVFAFSPSLLPKPTDWPSNYHVIGQIDLKGSKDYQPLPEPLQEYLDKCRMSNFHVIYVGFGSLGFFPSEKVTEIFDVVAKTIEELARSMPVRAIIQTALSSTPGKSGRLSISSSDVTANGEKEPAFFVFDDTVDHKALFPQVSLVVSHGGVGTIQAALSSGKPVLSMCCLPTSDQSFWADLASRRRLGPQYFWVKELSVARLMKGMQDGISNLEEYTQNAENIAKAMALEDGISRAMHILEEEACLASASTKTTSYCI